MKLPIPTFGKKGKSEYYLALLLRDEKAGAVILEEQDGKVTIISKNEEPFTTSIEEASTEEMLDVLDRTISRAEDKLPANVVIEKTVFGVKEEWIEEKKIQKDYLAKLKKVCDGLGLSPIGFLVLTEAIAHLIQEEEGAPVSAVLVEIGRKTVRVSLLRAGRIIASKSSAIGESVPQTVDTILKHFADVEVLPARVILFNGGSEEELAQEFISYQWSKSLPFLHVPQISILPNAFDAKAVVFGAATQMGFDVLGPLGNRDPEEIKTFEHKPKTQEEAKEPVKEEVEEDTDSTTNVDEDEVPAKDKVDDEEPKEDDDEAPPVVSGDNFGFVADQDIAVGNKPASSEKPARKHEDSTDDEIHTKPKIHHYAEEADVESKKHETAVDELYTTPTKRHQEYADENLEEEEERSSRTGRKGGFLARFSLAGILAPMKSIFTNVPRVSGALPRGKFLIILPLIALLLLGLGYLYIFKLGAQVTLAIEPRDAEQTETIILSATSPTDFSESTIAAKKITTTLDGSVSTPATGKKDTGTKAKGSLTIYNSASSRAQLSEGTVITSANNLEFTLDKDVTIASASGDIFSGTKPGTSQVAVTASEFGSDYNLPSNTKFTVSKSSTLAAKNDSAFSGGTKKTVTVVAKKDLTDLAAKLPKSLEEKAKTNLSNEVGGDETIIPIFLTTSLDNESYSKKVDEETKEVTLKAKVTFESLSYANKELIQYAQTVLKNKYDQDVTIPENSINNTLNGVKKKDEDEITAELAVKGNLLPKIDTNTIKQNVKGKSFVEVEEQLNDLPQVGSVTISLVPNIPFLPKTLPRIADNITVTLQTP